MSGWIGVDLDGTLAHFDRWRGPDSIGLPIPSMVKRVEAWIAEGREVRIFTARASEPRLIPPVKRWLKLHGLPDLRVTNVKDFQMIELWDDRAVQVIHNTGRAVQPNTLDEDHKPELIDPDAAPVNGNPAEQAEQELEPSASEVEAFRDAVKKRSAALDISLLDALDAGEEYQPSTPTAAVVDAIPTVVFKSSGEPIAPRPSDKLDAPRHFPAVSANLGDAPLLSEDGASAAVDEIRLPSPDKLFDPPQPPSSANKLNVRTRPMKGQLPALHVDDDELDDGFPSLRVEQH